MPGDIHDPLHVRRLAAVALADHIRSQVNQQIDRNVLIVQCLDDALRAISAGTESDERNAGLMVADADLTDLVSKWSRGSHLADLSLGESQRFEVSTQPVEVSQVQWVQAIDQENVNMVLFLLRQAAAQAVDVRLRRRQRMGESKAHGIARQWRAGRAGGVVGPRQPSAQARGPR